MSLPSSKIGTKSDLYRIEVTSIQIEEFRKAIGAVTPDAWGVASLKVAPSTFLTVFRQGEFELLQRLAMNLARVLHAEQEYEYEPGECIRAGDWVHFETVLAQFLEKRGSSGAMTFLTFETEFQVKRSTSVSRVGKSKTTIVIREKA